MVRAGILRASLAAVAVLIGMAPVARGEDAFYPEGGQPATQISRDFSLKDAARRGIVKLTGKGRAVAGDEVALKLTHKLVSGPVTVTVHVEFTTKSRVLPRNREKVAEQLPGIARDAQAQLNRGRYRTPSGDPIRFKLDWQFRDPGTPARPNFHQILIVDPTIDLDEPDPGFRAQFHEIGDPNGSGAVEGTFPTGAFGDPKVLAHEALHLAGLDDQYNDFYRVGGRDYPLPERAMTPSQLAAFARGHRPPLREGGRVVPKRRPGSGPCDIMGDGETKNCGRISKKDLKWLASRAAIQVTAEPGDILLNKDKSKQNFGVGFRTRVFARPGETTLAEGVFVYCIDNSLEMPESENGFDAIGHASDLPGFEPLGTLLEYAARTQGSFTNYLAGMDVAVWNVTDQEPLDTSGFATEARAFLAGAGLAENSVPGGLPYLPNPNAGSPDTAGVTQTGVEPSLPSKPSKPLPPVSIGFARLYPSRVSAGRVRSDLLVSGTGDVRRITFKLERRVGRRWRSVRSLRKRRMASGTRLFPLELGRLRRGRHRLVVSLAGPSGPRATRRVGLSVS
jgi:hypothetical protein